MIPADALEQARPGDTVHITLRGPCSERELDELRREHEDRYPGIEFVLAGNGDEITARIERGHG